MRTPLFEKHQELGAKIVDFAGWEMPIQYKGILHEHHSVRNGVGIFDVSHMGRIAVEGPDAEPFLDYLSTNLIQGKKPFTATYTVWANEEGGCVDDGIVFKKDAQSFFVVVNASNRQKDLRHFQSVAERFNVLITPKFEHEGILAVQGPKAKDLIEGLFPEASGMKPMRFQEVGYRDGSIILATTGYTGAGGYELFVRNALLISLWEELLESGSALGIEPIGLGARDTLRLEKGYALYGHELNEELFPLETVSAWTVKMQEHDFIGKQAMQESQKKGRREYGVVLVEKGIAREGCPVFHEGEKIGEVTSGSFSPTMEQAIAIVLSESPLETGDQVEIQIRKHRCKAKVVKLPFI